MHVTRRASVKIVPDLPTVPGVTVDSRRRGRHRAPGQRGWAPRALLGALIAPTGVVAGVGAAVAAAALDRPALAVVGVALAGAPGIYHAARSAVLAGDLELTRASRREALAEAVAARREVAELTAALRERQQAAPAVAAVEAAAPAVPVVVEDEVSAPVHAAVEAAPATVDRLGLVDARIDTGELQRIWDLGEAPATPPARVTVAEPRVLVGFVGDPASRPRSGTADARVLDAIALAEADPLTRALELPSRGGRHAAQVPLDAPMPRRRDLADARLPEPAPATRLEVVRRRGRHVA